jgi:hypothetical protein
MGEGMLVVDVEEVPCVELHRPHNVLPCPRATPTTWRHSATRMAPPPREEEMAVVAPFILLALMVLSSCGWSKIATSTMLPEKTYMLMFTVPPRIFL